ncbi:conserved hypothetical protein [Ricinus communis]|uniref:BHLH domain-containing protein n=1 Tax=Ricinus communis TaxID=3988 RepID=B9SJW0_RICCO|nr:conserved hypothetical protein [Ricinus communis]
MNPQRQCSCMLSDCSPADPNLCNTVKLETDTDSFDDIFGSLSDIQSISYPQQASPTTDQFSTILCIEASSASTERNSTETPDDDYRRCTLDLPLNLWDLGRGIPRELKENKHDQNKKAMLEKKRRNRIRDKLKALGELIPNCHKQDTASILVHAIDYIRSLQLQIYVRHSLRGLLFNKVPLNGKSLSYFLVKKMSNMNGGAICQALCMSAVPYTCPVMPTNPTAMEMFNTCQFNGLQQMSPHLLFPPQPFLCSLPVLGPATSTNVISENKV